MTSEKAEPGKTYPLILFLHGSGERGTDNTAQLKHVVTPIWAFHGEADPVVQAQSTRNMLTALEKAGGKPKAPFYPGVQHNSWIQTYADPEGIKWLLAQRKNRMESRWKILRMFHALFSCQSGSDHTSCHQ